MVDAVSEAEGRIGLETRHINEMRDLEMRAAIMTAQLSRAPADLEAAARVMDRNYDGVLRQAADHAGDWGDLCDNPGEGALAAVAAACRDENAFRRRVVDFWRNQAHLDLLMAADADHYAPSRRFSQTSGSGFVRREAGAPDPDWSTPYSFDAAMALLEASRGESALARVHRFDGGAEAMAALLLAHADAYARQADSIRRRGDRRSDWEAEQRETAALQDLWHAEQFAPSADTPGRFRQVAERYVAIEAGIQARHAADPEDERRVNPAIARQAAYFRTVLAELDRIAVGESALH